MKNLKYFTVSGPVDRYDVTADLKVEFSVYCNGEDEVWDAMIEELTTKFDDNFDVKDYDYSLYYPDLFGENLIGGR